MEYSHDKWQGLIEGDISNFCNINDSYYPSPKTTPCGQMHLPAIRAIRAPGMFISFPPFVIYTKCAKYARIYKYMEILWLVVF